MAIDDDQARQKTAKIFRSGRKLRGVTQDKMSQLMGVSQGTISKLESATLMPDAALWYKFCKQMDLNADLTYRSGYIFTASNDELVEHSFKIKGTKSKNDSWIKVKECIPFVNVIDNLGGSLKLSSFLKQNGVDSDVLAVPQLKVPLYTLSLIFDFIEYEALNGKFNKQVALEFVQNAEYLMSDTTKSLTFTKLIGAFRLSSEVFSYKHTGNHIIFELDPMFKYSKNDERFLKSYSSYKAEQLKYACKEIFPLKGVNLSKEGDFSYRMEYAL